MTKEISKLLSHVLRHAPERLDIILDENGWTFVDSLISKAKEAGFTVDREVLEAVVASNDKKRFTLSEDGNYIRAAQGHSLKIDLALEPCKPPLMLFHGTARSNLDIIFQEGLKPGRRQHVHLSLNEETATKVGARHGKPVVLQVNTGSMHKAGFKFWRADNGVWLTEFVPQNYLVLS